MKRLLAKVKQPQPDQDVVVGNNAYTSDHSGGFQDEYDSSAYEATTRGNNRQSDSGPPVASLGAGSPDTNLTQQQRSNFLAEPTLLDSPGISRSPSPAGGPPTSESNPSERLGSGNDVPSTNATVAPTPTSNTKFSKFGGFSNPLKRNQIPPEQSYANQPAQMVAPGPLGRGAGGRGGVVSLEPPHQERSAHQQQQQQQQQGGVLRPPPPFQVENAIGWTCASATFDYTYVLALCDHISLSTQHSKVAAKALKKELKYGVGPEIKERAIRLTGVMMRNADLRFRQQIASKSFLEAIKDLVTSKQTEERVVVMVMRVLSPLAFDYQKDQDLQSITALYNKLKKPTDPLNGEPLDPEDPLLTPTSDPRTSRGLSSTPNNRSNGGLARSSARMPKSTQEELKELKIFAEAAKGNARMLVEAVGFTPIESMDGNELIAEFHTKCLASQERIMENLDWTTVQADQSRQALIASKAADVSGEGELTSSLQPTTAANLGGVHSSPTSAHLASNNPFAPIISGETQATEPIKERNVDEIETEEEKTLSTLLSANTDVLEALKLYDDRKRQAAENRDVAIVSERSKTETKFDRSRAGTPDPITGSYLHAGKAEEEQHQGGSSSQSSIAANELRGAGSNSGSGPTMTTHGEDNRRMSMNPYAAYLSPSSPPQTTHASSLSTTNDPPQRRNGGSENESGNGIGGYIIPENFGGYGAGSMTDGANGESHQQLFEEPVSSSNYLEDPFNSEVNQTSIVQHDSPRRQGTDGSSIIETPVKPSEKALGKLRRYSEMEGH